jgi:DNA-directed RNA polymerase specialized sigma24 family protein
VEVEALSVPEILRRYLTSQEEEDAEESLTTLVVVHAHPVARRVITRRLHGAPPDQLEDVCNDALASLIARLRALRRDTGTPSPITDFAAYAAGVTANAVNQHLAARYPERNRLRRRLRMVCVSDGRLRIWESSSGSWLCGRAGESGDDRARAGDLEACKSELARVRLPRDLAELVMLILKQTGQPVELNELTQLCASVTGAADQPQDVDRLEDTLVDTAALASYRTEMGGWVRHLWTEIASLPDRQRIALLLNLRSAQGTAIELIEDLGIATFSQLAEVLSMTKEALAELWNRLPLDDKEIAEKLGVERQQVINLRSAARQRLQRRMSQCQYRGGKTNSGNRE